MAEESAIQKRKPSRKVKLLDAATGIVFVAALVGGILWGASFFIGPPERLDLPSLEVREGTLERWEWGQGRHDYWVRIWLNGQEHAIEIGDDQLRALGQSNDEFAATLKDYAADTPVRAIGTARTGGIYVGRFDAVELEISGSKVLPYGRYYAWLEGDIRRWQTMAYWGGWVLLLGIGLGTWMAVKLARMKATLRNTQS